MPKFAANLSTLFTEVPLAERFKLAQEAGFTHVEVQFPYELDIDTLKTQLDQHALQLILINLPAGDWSAGDRGIACDPARVAEFRAGVEQCAEYAKALGVEQVNCLSGLLPPEVDKKRAENTLIENLRYAGSYMEERGISLLIEPINTLDVPGFFLSSMQQAVALIERAIISNLAVQYDVYHMQIMEGNLIHTLRSHLSRVGHIQVADVPGRHEPGTGEINFSNLFDAIDTMGYTGYVAFEYFPEKDTQSGLAKIASWR